jgi:hypothetical protein
MSTEFDDLRHRLASLGDDLRDTRLPGANAARRRAQQRARRQATGAALGAVAAVAVGAIIVGGLPTLSSAPVQPADTPTHEPTEEPTTEPSADALLLTVDDLEAANSIDEPVGWTLTETATEPSFACAPAPGDADLVVQRSFATPDEGRLDQFIEISTAERAQARLEEIAVEIVACVEQRNAENSDDNWLSEIWTVDGIGDEAWLGEYLVEPRGELGELMVVQMSAVRAGDAVIVLAQGGLGMHGHLEGPLPHDLAAAAATKVCEISGGSCVTDPRPQRIYPDSAPVVVPGWLTIEDIAAEAPVLAGITSADFPVEAQEGVYVCVEIPVARPAGALSFQARLYVDLLDDPDLHVSQVVSRFGSATEAEAHYADLVGWAAACGAEQVGEVSGDGYEGITWRSTDEFITFYLSAVIHGEAVSLITIPEPSAGAGDLPAEQVQALVARAGERLAELD